MALISRDPFARQEIHRESLMVSPNQSCDWCGGFQLLKSGARKLFSYSIETDGGRSRDIGGLFCSVGCMRNYHGDRSDDTGTICHR